jgi:hypothetical protein
MRLYFMRTAFAWAAGLVTTPVLTFLFHRVMMGVRRVPTSVVGGKSIGKVNGPSYHVHE